jgi:hypothetical protein
VKNVKCVCGKQLELQVLRSAAGYYVGYFCDDDGPYDRMSEYFETRQEACDEFGFIMDEEDLQCGGIPVEKFMDLPENVVEAMMEDAFLSPF